MPDTIPEYEMFVPNQHADDLRTQAERIRQERIAALSRTDPSGEEQRFFRPYTPVVPQQDMMPSPSAMRSAFDTLPVAEAEKTVSAAIQFQGLRAYNKAIQSGIPAHEAMAKYGPMMFYQRQSAFGPAMRAMRPAQMTPYQQGMLDLARKRFEAPKPRSFRDVGGALYEIPPTGEPKLVVGAKPKMGLAEKAEGEMLQSKLKELLESKSQLGPEKQPTKVLGMTFGGNVEEISNLRKQEQSIRARLQELEGATETPSKTESGQPALAKPVSGKRIRVKSPEGKIGTVSEENLEEALKAGYTKL